MMDVMWSIAGFLVAIGVLVAFHEFGHYWVARRCGVKVLRFSIGFGKPLLTRRAADGVEWVVSAIPLGGYVKMLDSREGEVPEHECHLAFDAQPVGKRAMIVAAGPVFNFILAIAFYWLIFVIGVEGMRPMIAAPTADSIAAQAGLKAGDEIMTLGGKDIATWEALHTELIDQALNGEPVVAAVRSTGGSTRQVTLALHHARIDPAYLFDDLGLRPYEPPIAPVLESVMPGEAADRAGLQAGDRLLSVDGQTIVSWQDWARWVRDRAGAVVQLEFERQGQVMQREVIIGEVNSVGRFGASVAVSPEMWQDLRAEHRRGPVESVQAAVARTWQMSALTLKMMGRMVTGDVSVKNVSGPIQIAQVAGFSAQVGLVSFLGFLAIVSISLGVLNLLPVPMLDGGHLLYYAVEAVKGSPVSDQTMEMGARVGLLMLAGLMSLAFYNDIARLLS